MKNNKKKDMHENELNDQIEEANNPVNSDGTANEQQPVAEQEKGNEDLTRIKAELDEQKDKYVRLFAEFDNYRRRTSKESIELRQTAGAEVITSLLDVLDDMDRAEKQMQESGDENSLKEGSLLIFNKFRKILQSKGLRSIETLHTDFDVEKDEAITEIEVEDESLKGKVVAEIQKGYFLNDKLIRFAKVVVGK